MRGACATANSGGAWALGSVLFIAALCPLQVAALIAAHLALAKPAGAGGASALAAALGALAAPLAGEREAWAREGSLVLWVQAVALARELGASGGVGAAEAVAGWAPLGACWEGGAQPARMAASKAGQRA